MPADRHGWNSFTNYYQIHQTVFDQFRRDYFVLFDNLKLNAIASDVLKLEGNVYLRGGLRLTVSKLLKLRTVSSTATEVDEVRTVAYRYNFSLTRWAASRLAIPAGNILRYDNDHPSWRFPGHATEHHKHTFDPIGTQCVGSPECIGDDWPTMGEVLQECLNYYWSNYELLHQIPNQFEEEEEDDVNDDE